MRSLFCCYAHCGDVGDKLVTHDKDIAGSGDHQSLVQFITSVSNKPYLYKRAMSCKDNGEEKCDNKFNDAYMPTFRYVLNNDEDGHQKINTLSEQNRQMRRENLHLFTSLLYNCNYVRALMHLGENVISSILFPLPPRSQLTLILSFIERFKGPESVAEAILYKQLCKKIMTLPLPLQNQCWPAMSYHRLSRLDKQTLASACHDLLSLQADLSKQCRLEIALNVLRHIRLLDQQERVIIVIVLLNHAAGFSVKAREKLLLDLSLDIFHLAPSEILTLLEQLLVLALTLTVAGRLEIFSELRWQLPHINLSGINLQAQQMLSEYWQRSI